MVPEAAELSGVLLSVEQVGPGIPEPGRNLDGQDIRDDWKRNDICGGFLPGHSGKAEKIFPCQNRPGVVIKAIILPEMNTIMA